MAKFITQEVKEALNKTRGLTVHQIVYNIFLRNEMAQPIHFVQGKFTGFFSHSYEIFPKMAIIFALNPSVYVRARPEKSRMWKAAKMLKNVSTNIKAHVVLILNENAASLLMRVISLKI